MKGGLLSFVSEHAERDDSGQVYLTTKQNLDLCLNQHGLIIKMQAPILYKHLSTQNLSGTSLIDSIISRSQSALALLIKCGLNQEIQQLAGANTITGFIEGLKQNAANPKLISPLDVKYLFSLPEVVFQPSENKVINSQSFGFFNDGASAADCSSTNKSLSASP